MSYTRKFHTYMSFSTGLARLARPRVPNILQVIATYWHHHGQRCDLANLDHRLLKDIGLTAPKAAKEIEKPFWRT